MKEVAKECNKPAQVRSESQLNHDNNSRGGPGTRLRGENYRHINDDKDLLGVSKSGKTSESSNGPSNNAKYDLRESESGKNHLGTKSETTWKQRAKTWMGPY